MATGTLRIAWDREQVEPRKVATCSRHGDTRAFRSTGRKLRLSTVPPGRDTRVGAAANVPIFAFWLYTEARNQRFVIDIQIRDLLVSRRVMPPSRSEVVMATLPAVDIFISYAGPHPAGAGGALRQARSRAGVRVLAEETFTWASPA